MKKLFFLAVAWLGGCQSPFPGGGSQDDDDEPVTGRDPRCADDNGGISLLPGFCASVVADGVGRARHMVVSPAGDLYVALNDAFDGSEIGGLLALRDEDDNGVAETQELILEGGGSGVAFHDNMVYFGQPGRIVRFVIESGELLPVSAQPEVVVQGLPADGDHTAKSIVIDGNRLFVNVGSATNSCQELNREPGSPGLDPCPELEERAGIWEFDANTLNQGPEDGVRFATGLRNANAIAIEPQTGELVAAINSRDEFLDDWPALYSPFEDMMLPSEELFVLQEGGDYGWPYCYFDPAVGKVLAPEYGGDGQTIGRCANTLDPDLALPAHWAPLALHFIGGEEFPDSLQGDLLITFHGSWHEPGNHTPPPGYNVGLVPFSEGSPELQLIQFAGDFAGDVDAELSQNAEFRPVGLAQAPDGSLYISDDQNGRIWRVFWGGPGAGTDLESEQ